MFARIWEAAMFNKIQKHCSSAPMEYFFQTILPSSGVYFLGQKLHSGGFQHYPYTDLAEMVEKALELNEQKQCTYFACASYHKPKFVSETGKITQRVKENVQLVKSFWLDIDCGINKAASGDGYSTIQEAQVELDAFCEANDLPLPLVVCSGGGIHCYWPLTQAINKDQWLHVAQLLKELTKSSFYKLLADQSRTSDISSILRPVGTNNWKWKGDEHVPYFGTRVEILRVADPVAYESFKNAIESAVDLSRSKGAQKNVPNNTNDRTQAEYPPMKISELEKVLKYIDPDNPYPEWWKTIAGLTHEYGEDIRTLARIWSAGELHDKIAEKFNAQDFENTFSELVNRRSDIDYPISLGTVLHQAMTGGWKREAVATEQSRVEKLNQEYAWIQSYASIYRLKYGDFISPEKFKHELANQKVVIDTGKGTKSCPVNEVWMSSPDRRQHTKLVFEPELPDVTTSNCLNVWSGFDVDAISSSQSDCQPFVDLLKRLIPEKEALVYTVSWLAHLIQKPGTKMHTALVFWSRDQGVGKNLLFECIKDIIGHRHASVVGQADFNRDFNGWLKEKILIIGDEVSDQDRRIGADKLKGLITGRTVQINEKYQPVVELENKANFIFLSNHNDALFIDDGDRRYFVWEINAGRLHDKEVQAFCNWRDNGGLGKLRGFLESLPIKNFKPHAPAPMTLAKQAMMRDSGSDLELFIRDLINASASSTLNCELATATELALRYAQSRGHTNTPSEKAVANACQKLGAYRTSLQLRLTNGKRIRLIALERPDYWEKQHATSWVAEYEKKR